MKHRYFKNGFLSLLFFVATGVALAQVDTGSINGSVTDASGASVTHAAITIVNQGTNATRHVVSGSNGAFVAENLPPGKYNLIIAAEGFSDYRAQFEVTVGGHANLNARLKVGALNSVVEVVAGGTLEINTTNPEVAEVISPEQVKELPSLTRNVYDFVGLSGNVSNGDSSQGHTQNTTGRGVGFSINGQRSSGTEILLDGVENTELFSSNVGLPVPVDSIGEYRVLTSNFGAQYGRASGGVVNAITASGSNTWHGTFSEFNRLAAYTANTVTNAQSGTAKGGYTRNQPSFFISGPIQHDKLFFAVGSEWIKVRSNATVTRWVPTSNLLAYTASSTQAFLQQNGANTFNYTRTVTNSAAGTPFATVPSTTPIFGLVTYQVPQDAGGGEPQDTYNYTIRGDYNFSSKTQFFGRYVGYSLTEPLGTSYHSPYAQYNVGNQARDFAVIGGVSHAFTPALLTSGRVSFSRINISNSTTKAGLNTPGLSFSSSAQILGTSISLPGNGYGLPYGGPQNVLQWNQDISLNHGKHNYQAGGQILYIQENRIFGAYAQATESLPAAGDAKGYKGFLNGTVGTFSTAIDPQGHFPGETITTPATQPNFARSDRFHDWAVYVQDSWNILPHLSINYGVRYEYYGVQHNNHPNLDSNFYYGSGSTYAQQIRNGAVAIAPNSPIGRLWNPRYGAVSPRVGFAYDLHGNGKTVVRGGWGISYERNFGNVTFNVIQNPPNYAVVVQNNVAISSSNLGALGQSIGPIVLPKTSLRHVDQDIKTAQTHFWSLSAEHQLANNIVIGADYLGARGIHLYDIKNINGIGSGNYLAGDDASVSLTRLRTTQYSNINSRGSNGDSYYEALNLRFATQNLHHTGFGATANYTFGHTIDDLSSTFSDTSVGGGGNNLGYTNPFNPGYDRGNSDLDVRQRLVLAPIWVTPWFKGSHDLKGRVLGDWLVSGIYTVRSGTPFTFYDSSNNYGDYYNIARYAPSTKLNQWKYKKSTGAVPGAVNEYYLAQTLPVGKWITNPKIGGVSNWAFPTDSPQRNSFYGPGAWNLDLAVSKKFALTERINLELRAESFDILNHHNLYVEQALADQGNFEDSNGNLLAPSITAKRGGVNGTTSEERRFGQLALKINF